MIKDNILRVEERIAASCARIKADPRKITVVCVTKGRSLEEISEAFEAGFRHLGESRVQEARVKSRSIPSADWQMIGRLQTNKVKEALKIFSLIHSVDSLELACQINKQASRIGKIQDILLEVKTSPEESKSGFIPQALPEAAGEILRMDNLKVKGLMTIAPFVDEAEGSREYFAGLRKLRDRINPSWSLSMGMTDDFEVAIEEGADIVRLGRAIFG
jgi:pyridoxal phosphate enzyme (YggS family)